MPLAIRPCTVADLESAPNIEALMRAYSDESAIDGLGPANAQWDSYHGLEAAGVLHALGAWLDGTMVGCVLLLVSPLPHYGVVVASTESFFVDPDARSSGAGMDLLHAAEAVAAEAGAVGLFVSAPVGGSLERVMPRVARYRESNRVFFRSLLP